MNKNLSNPKGIKFLKGKVAGDDPLRRRPDISRARKLLNWKPAISLESGLKMTVPYFKKKIGL
jgi:nucleoside-diphosphate-sugar epimerase